MNDNMQLDTVAIRDVETPNIDAASFDQLDTMPEGFSLQSAYLKFDNPGDKVRVFWVGMTTMLSQNQEPGQPKREVPAGVFLWRETPTSGPKRVIHAGDNLTKQLLNMPHHGQPIPLQITYVGEQKANTGRKFKAFDVVVLNGGPAPRTDQQQRNYDTQNGNTDLHSPEPFGEKKTGAQLLPVSNENRQAVSGLQADIDEGYFMGDAGAEKLKGALLHVAEQLKARNIAGDFVKAKSPKPDSWSVFKTAVAIMVNYDQKAPVAA